MQTQERKHESLQQQQPPPMQMPQQWQLLLDPWLLRWEQPHLHN